MKRALLVAGSFLMLAFNADLSAQTVTSTNTPPNQNTTVLNTANLPGFPVFVDTGNPQLDASNYQNAKQKWISENQELYNKELERMRIESLHNDENNPEKLLKEGNTNPK